MTKALTGPILIVERDVASRQRLADWLARQGAAVVTEARALEAVSRFLAGPIGAVLLGVDPQDLSDLGAIARVRELPHGRDVPIFILTRAGEGALARIRMMAAPLRVTEYHAYPLDLPKLWARISAPAGTAPPKAAALSNAPPSASQPSDASPSLVTMGTLVRFHQLIGPQDHYERLGITPQDGPSAVRQAFLAIVYRFRPQALADPKPEAMRLLRGIVDHVTQSYEVLRDPTRRHAYDAQRAAAARPRPEPAPAPASVAAPAPPAPPPPPARAPLPPPPARPPPTAVRPPPVITRSAPAPEPTTNDDDPWAPRSSLQRETHEDLAASAQVQAVMGDYDGAVKILRAALALKPDSDDYKFRLELNLGRLSKKNGAMARARHHFEEAIRLSPPGNPAASEELAELDGKPPPSDPKTPGRLSGLFKKTRR